MYPFLRFLCLNCAGGTIYCPCQSLKIRKIPKNFYLNHCLKIFKYYQSQYIVWISYKASYDCQYYLSIIKYFITCFQLYNFFGKFPTSCMQTFLLSNSLVLETKINLFSHTTTVHIFPFLALLRLLFQKYWWIFIA